MIALDASVVAAWFLAPEEPLARAALEALATEDAIAPGSLYAEVAQALMRAERQLRFSMDDLLSASDEIGMLPLSTQTPSFGAIVSLARRHNLSAYDAAYLAVAIDNGAALATLDRSLRDAALREELAWAPPEEHNV